MKIPKSVAKIKKKKKMSPGEFLLSLAKMGEKLRVDAGPDASTTIDETLYGLKRK